MIAYKVKGGKCLHGTVNTEGAKNALLPEIAGSILTDDVCFLENIPKLTDTENMLAAAKYIGASYEKDAAGRMLRIKTEKIKNIELPYELAGRLRASFLFAGAVLARTGFVRIAMPGGCDIGLRPIDLHLKGFSAMGAEVLKDGGYVSLSAAEGLRGGEIYLDFPSVGATENIMIAATLADGKTVIKNAAAEPEIEDLAEFLQRMGADIKGAGTDNIEISGKKKLYGAIHSVMPDRIEAGTFMTACGITGGDILIQNIIPVHMKPVTAKLREAGIVVIENENSIRVISNGRGSIVPIDIRTLPYPGFPTDMQAQMASLLTQASGTSLITETVFENRFRYVGELSRLGAVIRLNERTAVINGLGKDGNIYLTGTETEATDLRGGAALVIAALAAKGETTVTNASHIERGYQDFAGKLSRLGAEIARLDC
ncbi:MAG: UDP-N-acetylglucosamine 1-carboxyvinyltransferase [Clostridia bacterium]|nr:UDP-N-acetylglucosamine 1-carboxyvinyltransferase [Clostridia bacterium]